VTREKVVKKKVLGPTQRWSIADAKELYLIDKWGLGYFDVNKNGNLVVHPTRHPELGFDLKELIDELIERGIYPPVLLRFTDILRSRIDEINQAFISAIQQYGYQGRYRGVYPIKVNQHRAVVENIVEFGRPYDFGLEAGSKPELLLSIALQENPKALIVCNGYKDREYIETALFATKLGRQVFIVVEKLTELPLILQESERLQVRPNIGLRVKLSSQGRGKWEGSGGDKSKFGLFVSELLQAVEMLRDRACLGSFQLLHFHLGSQISSIQTVKEALREATKIFAELHRLGVPLRIIDVGGGLAVDYDGSRTNFASSANYTLKEYAADVVSALFETCQERGIPHPDIVSESGRAVVAHMSALIFEVLGSSELGFDEPPVPEGCEENELLRSIREVDAGLSRKNFQEAFHDAVQIKNEALSLFNLGYLDLKTRAQVESVFWRVCQKIIKFIRELELDYVPDELEGLEQFMADTYYGNFSVFQSVPDHWAVKQLFPVLPIHRLNQRPTRRATFADITCDSDGKFDQFIDLRDVKDTIALHPQAPDEPYYCGIFLVGAYQEILGDLHNLFGYTNTVHVSILEDGVYQIDRVIPGETVSEVLSQIQYHRVDLVNAVRKAVELGLAQKRITLKESKQILTQYEQGLAGYTYLEKE
jgi:arginine decarboxylase